MRRLFNYIVVCLVIGSVIFVTGCGSQNVTNPEKPIKVGVSAGPHAEIMEVVKKVAEKEGLKLEIVEFNDYMQPNIALNQGDIDVNSYQHQPWLDNQIKDRHYELVSIAKTIIFPMGIYSKKIKSIADVKEGAIVAIPNDPTNGSRALAILEKNGLLKMNPNAGLKATAADIIDNPKGLKVKELDAAQIPRSLDDVDLAAINTNYAIVAGLVPNRDALAIEDSNSPYANLLVVRTKDKDNPVFQRLIKAYKSEEVKQYVLEHFQGSANPTW
ncbi:MAG TPA: MetQ/NlpA family ABC transporter substrate-binding protein [Negativicutes bacterium]|jgi:D-methionine transport system substrate-binding protein